MSKNELIMSNMSIARLGNMTMPVLRLSLLVLLETKIERQSHVKRMSADEPR